MSSDNAYPCATQTYVTSENSLLPLPHKSPALFDHPEQITASSRTSQKRNHTLRTLLCRVSFTQYDVFEITLSLSLSVVHVYFLLSDTVLYEYTTVYPFFLGWTPMLVPGFTIINEVIMNNLE